MSETTGPKVPRPTTTEKVTDAASNAAETVTDKVEHAESGIRARVRAIRNDYDVDTIEKDAKPFLTGALIVGAMVVDPVLGATVAVNRVGRYVQARHRRHEASTTTE
jgi:hypothetical protein